MRIPFRKPVVAATAATSLVLGAGIGVALGFSASAGAHTGAPVASITGKLSAAGASAAVKAALATEAGTAGADASGTTGSPAVTPEPSPAATAGTRTWVTGTTRAKDTEAHAGVSGTADDLSIVANAIGISESALKSALEAGQSIAQIATAHGVSPATVIDALVADETKEIDAAVPDGRLTQTQATALIGRLTTMITNLVNATFPGAGASGSLHLGAGFPGIGDPLAIVASALGITEDALKSALAGGQSLAEIATAHGVSPATLVNDLVSKATTLIDQLVSMGILPKTVATTILSQLTTVVADIVNGNLPSLGTLQGLPGLNQSSLPGLSSLQGLPGLSLLSGLPGLGSLNLASFGTSGQFSAGATFGGSSTGYSGGFSDQTQLSDSRSGTQH
jgi:uncharacterized protein YidB (DUF937 family)